MPEDAPAAADLVQAELRGLPVTHIRGEVDLSNAEVVGQGLADALGSAPKSLVVDLSQVRFMDSSALRMLLNLGAAARERGRRLHLVAAEGSFAAHLMEVTRLEDLLAVHPSLDDAVESLSGS